MGNWISVKDRLPSQTGGYIVYDSGLQSVVFDYWTGANWYHYAGVTHLITHWMSKPEPPKGE